MTSNLGSSMIREYASSDDEKLKELLSQELRRYFRPEFLNRIDETLIFHPLGREDIRKIVILQLKRLSERLASQNIILDVDISAEDFIADAGYDPEFGARPLKRAIIKLVETPLSHKLISGEIVPGSKVTVSVENDGLTFKTV